MTRTAMTTAIFVAAMCVLFFSYARRHRASRATPDQSVPDPAEQVEVLPVVNPGWSNLTARGTATTAAAFSASPATTQEVSAATEAVPAAADPNMSSMGARAKEMLAQVALASVGLDPEADQYWMAAINDPNISATERRALILELDQAGFADPRRPTADDLPLVASRIALLEQLGSNALDSANSSAFEEAYNELLAMFASITAPELSVAAQPTGTGE